MTHLFPAVSVDNAPPTPTAPLINAGSPEYRELVRAWNARPCPQDADDDASECAGSEVKR